MKIKNKKQLNLPQLIEWAYHEGSDIRDEKIKSESMTVTFSEIGTPHIETKFHFLQVDELFTVEVEEEITEGTVLPKLVERWKHDDEGDETFRYVEHDDKSINRVLFLNPESVEVTHFYAEIDGELELIWRDGKLVE